jgi:hypothetical protein
MNKINRKVALRFQLMDTKQRMKVAKNRLKYDHTDAAKIHACSAITDVAIAKMNLEDAS